MRWLIGCVVGMTILAVIAATILWLTDQIIISTVVWMIIAGLWLMLVIILVWMASSWWTAQTMERGAEIALRAQEINDTWDAKKTASIAQLVREGIRVGRSNSQHRPPALPLPSQEVGWLPELSTFETEIFGLNGDENDEDI